MEKKRAHAHLKGNVQGVGMRAYVSSLARKLKLSGFVRNLEDGRVEVVVEGDDAVLLELFKAIREGPYGSYVRHLELTWHSPTHQFERFEITY